MHIIESIKDNYLICDCCGDRIAPDEVAVEKTDKEGRTIHICIDCETYNNEPEMTDTLEESIEDEFIADLETYGLEKDCIDYYIDDDLNDVHRPLQDQMEDLINDEEFIQYGVDIPSKLRDDTDDNIYEISDGECHTLDEMLLRLEKYKHDERTPLCSALYKVLSKVKDELCALS